MATRPRRSGAPRRDERMSALAAAVRRRRESLGLRQEEVADLAGCSERFVHSLENGKETLRFDKVLDVLAVLGIGLSLTPGHGALTDATSDRAPERP